MDAQRLSQMLKRIGKKIAENKDYLVKLDQQNGDGDLGISMNDGFKSVCLMLETTDEKDLGKLLMKAGNAFNDAAPSSLGTILSFGFMGMARCLKGTVEATPQQAVAALRAGVDRIMEKAGSKPGQRTILDSLCPAVEVCEQKMAEGNLDLCGVLTAAAGAAAEGAEATKQMKPVHGRAAYYGEKSLGHLDGGAVVGKLIFEALCEDWGSEQNCSIAGRT